MLRLALILLILCCHSVLATDLGNGVIYHKNPNNVGIGIKAPGARLDINGDIMITTNGHIGQFLYHDLDTDTYLKFTDDDIEFSSGSETLAKFHEDATQDYVKLGDGGDVDINLNDDLYVIGSTGNVSIGTTNNYERLTVEGGLALDEISAPSNIAGYGKVYVDNGNKELYFRASDQSAVRITNNGSLASSGGTPGGSNTWFQFNDSGSFAGNGALAFTKSSRTLTVNGSAVFDIDSTTVSIADTNISLDGATTTFTQTGATGTITLAPKAGANLNVSLSGTGDFAVSTSQLYVDTSASNVGINTTIPGKALEINSSAGNNLRLTYNDSDGSATNYSDFSMSSGGDLTIAASGGDISLSDENITGTGAWDLGSATSFEIPNSAAPTVNTAGEIALDTTITSHQPLMKYYSGTEEMTVIALPTTNLGTTNGHVITYNAANDEFTMTSVSGSGASEIDDLSDGKTSSVSVFLGSNAGAADSGSSYSVGVGVEALEKNTSGGTYNTAMGFESLNGNTVGDYNTAIGARSMKTNGQGSNNVAIGYLALHDNNGDDNVAIGVSALANANTGRNTAIGFEALEGHTTGGSNVAVGYQSLWQNDSGTYNTAIGTYAMYLGTTGDFNVALGYDSLRNSTGDDNTAIGTRTANSGIGIYNGTYLGYQAGYGLSHGDNNVLLGYESGNSIDSGSNNVTVGYYAGQNITSGSSNIIIGASNDATSATASNQLDIGDTIYADMSTDQVSIGTTTNYGTLTVEGSLALDEISAPTNTTSGYGRIYVNSSNSKLYFRDDGGTNYNLINGDAFSSASYLRSDATTTYSSGTLTLNSGTSFDIDSTNVSIADNGISLDGAHTIFTQTTGAITMTPANGSNMNINLRGVGDFAVDTNKLFVNNNGNVGIGYTTPNQLLSVNGAISIKEGSAPSASSTFGKLYASTSNSRLYYLDDSGSSYNLTNGAVTYAPGGSNKNLQYNNSGAFGGAGQLYYNGFYLGISAPAPLDQLHVATTGAGSAYARFTNSDTGSTSTDGSRVGISGTEELEIRNYENDDIIFYTNDTERMRILGAGRVGIGTSNPANFKLEINGGDFGPTNTASVNIGGSSRRFNRLYTKEAFFTHNGGTLWGSSKDYAYKQHFLLAQINNTTPKTLTDINGDVFSYDKTYKVTAHNPGTATKTGAIAYYIGNGSSSFELFRAFEQGRDTEDIEFYLDSGVPKVRLYGGTTTRAVQVLIEESPIFGKDNYAFGPIQAFSSPTPGVINLKGRDSGAAIYRAVANSDTLYSELMFSSTNGSGAAVDKWGVGALGDSHVSGANRFYIYQYADRNDTTLSRFRMIVSNNGNFHYNFMGSGVNDNYGKYVFNGVVALKEESSAPSNSTGFGKVYVDSSNKELYYRASDQSATKLTNNGSPVTGLFENYFKIADEKSSGTTSQSITSGAWRTRDLNTEVIDDNNLVSISSNKFTLQSGTYYCIIMSPIKSADKTRIRLRNVSDNRMVLISSGHDTSVAALPITVTGQFTITSQKDFDVQYYSLGNGQGGDALSIGIAERYTEVECWKKP